MRKIPSLFVRDASRRYVIDEVTPGCEWVLAGEGVATRKFDGTCVLIDGDGEAWARREVKAGKKPPPFWIPVDADEVTGKVMGWEPMMQSGWSKFYNEAIAMAGGQVEAGTYELCGPKINGNPEEFPVHLLVRHATAERYPAMNTPLGFEELRVVFSTLPWEGIVWHHPDGRMAKIKKRDFAWTM